MANDQRRRYANRRGYLAHAHSSDPVLGEQPERFIADRRSRRFIFPR